MPDQKLDRFVQNRSPRNITRDNAAQSSSAETGLRLMNIAPSPSRRRHRAHDRMLRRVKVFGCMLAGRRVAATHVAARLAFAQRHPYRPLAQALLTGVRSFLRGKSFAAKSFKCSHASAIAPPLISSAVKIRHHPHEPLADRQDIFRHSNVNIPRKAPCTRTPVFVQSYHVKIPA